MEEMLEVSTAPLPLFFLSKAVVNSNPLAIFVLQEVSNVFSSLIRGTLPVRQRSMSGYEGYFPLPFARPPSNSHEK